MKIKPGAGAMRGVRVVRDPLGILMDPYMDPTMGSQYGYVVVYGESEPAVFDGDVWHPVFEGDANHWASTLMERIQQQSFKIVQGASQDPAYAELAKLMGIPLPDGGHPFPIAQDATFDPPVVVDYSKQAK